MSTGSAKIAINSRVEYQGDAYVVEGFAGRVIILRSTHGAVIRESLSRVLTSTTFKAIEGYEVPQKANFLEGVDDASKSSALKNLSHLLEAMTGYQSGTSADALPVEPAPGYDVEMYSLNDRMTRKAKEINISLSTLWRWKSQYQKSGLFGLVDHRATKLSSSKIDERIQPALIFVIDSFENESNPTKQRIKRLTTEKLRKDYPEESIELPSESTFNRLIDSVSKGKRLFSSAKQRRGSANRPKGAYSQFVAQRPGEMVLIDSSPLDAFAMDPYSFLWIPVQLTIALDLSTRSLLAWRFTPVSVKGVDAALLLWDILRPKMLREGWSDAMRWAYVGVPESIIVEAGNDAPGASLLAVPFIHPESVIVDRGKVFLSEAFSFACTRLGINLYVARPYTPTDKAHVERIFKTIREKFVQNLKGYKGPDIYSRGINIEEQAYWFVDEIEAEFTQWVATYWQPRHHEGLFMPNLPSFEMSPNDAFEEGIARAGFMYAVPDQNLYYELLPTSWRTIQHYGVETGQLRYDADILRDFRDRKSPYLGEHMGKWPIRYDPRDRSCAYFYNPELAEWYTLRWTGAGGSHRPFDAKMVSYAKAKVLERGGNAQNHKEMEEALNDLLTRIDARQITSGRERRLAAVNAINTAKAQQDKYDVHPVPDEESSLLHDGPLHISEITGLSERTDEVEIDSVAAFRTAAAEREEDEDDDLF